MPRRNAVRPTSLLVAAGLAIFALANAAAATAAVTATTDANAVAGAITDAQPGLQTGASFSVNGPLAQCANGEDDDANGFVDGNDPGCDSAGDDSEEEGFGFSLGVPECQNADDDDGDGFVDAGSDPQCASATDADEGLAGDQQTECETAADDDGDADGGLFGADPECTSLNDDDEFTLEECGNTADDDSDGQADAADDGCSFPYDDDESSDTDLAASSNKQAGISDSALTGFPTSGGSFGVLTSGDAELADDPNNAPGDGEDTGGQAYQDAFDPVTLKIDINVPAGANCVGFDFRFLSEEFPEFVNAGFNDAFVAQLDQLSLSVSGQSINAPGDFAAGAGDSISVDSAGPSGMADFFATGTTYDGATARLVARTPVSPGSHSLFLTIFDAGDHILDSAVFVDNLRTSTEDPGKCKSLAVEPFEGTTGISFGNPGDPFDLNKELTALSFLATCNLPSGNELACTPGFNFAFTPDGGKAAGRAQRAKSTPLASGSATIPSGQTQLVTLAVPPAAKKAVKAAIDRPKKLLKKAKKLTKKAKQADGQKAAKLLKKAKKLKKKAKKLKKQPLGTVSGTVTNATNGATESVAFALERD
jgi:hypothetical protein